MFGWIPNKPFDGTAFPHMNVFKEGQFECKINKKNSISSLKEYMVLSFWNYTNKTQTTLSFSASRLALCILVSFNSGNLISKFDESKEQTATLMK